MAKAKTVRSTMSYEFNDMVLTLSDNDRVVRTFDFDKIPAKLDEKFMELGRKTKLANFAASAEKLGRDRLEMIDEGWELLKSGEWKFEREGGGPTVSAEVEALAAIKGVPVATIQKSLRNYTAEQKAKILANPAVVQRAAEIKAEREDASTDLDDMIE